MSTDLEVPVDMIPNGNGLSAQDIAGLGAMLTSVGLTRLQVQGIVARIQKVAAHVALTTIGEVLEDVRRIQEARLLEIISRVGAMPTMAGYVNRNHVIQIVSNTMATTPRQ